MAVKDQNFEMWAGDYKEITFEVEDVESLEGTTIKWAMAEAPDAEILVQKETPDGITIDENTFTVKLEAEDTQALKPRNYYHEAEVTDIESHTSTVAVGIIAIRPALLIGGEGVE